jgi:hypothetical protein
MFNIVNNFRHSAKPLFIGSNPVAASSNFKGLADTANPFVVSRPLQNFLSISPARNGEVIACQVK